MNSIICTFLGTPKIKENNNPIYLPPGKISGLFFYILLNKTTSRDEVANLLWPNSNEERAKISLRNALHKLRKYFEADIILTPNKSMLKINENIDFNIDVFDFDRDPIKNLELYKGEFLKGVSIKDSVEFENWILEQRVYYQEKYVFYIEEKIINDLENNRLNDVERNIRNLLQIDSFNENAYLLLMKFYMKNFRYDKVINEYYNVHKILSEELGISPNEKIEKIYKEALKKIEEKKGNKRTDKKLFLYDRNFELDQLRKTFNAFRDFDINKSVILKGEVGIGKTVLIKNILEEYKNEFNIYETNCYRVEQEFSFSPWHKIIYQLNNEITRRNEEPPLMWNDVLQKLFPEAKETNIKKNILENKENFNLDIIYNVVFSAIEQVSTDKKTIIVIEDIQWADTLSFKLLINLALHFNKDVMFIITTNVENDPKINNLILSLKSVNKILILKIKRFDKSVVENIVIKAFNNKKVTPKIIDEIYEKSKGNALFLKEYIELYKTGESDLLINESISDLLDNRFSNINIHERHILEKISLFYKEVSLDMLLKFGNINAFDLVTAINSLEHKNILEVYEEGLKTFIKFSHEAYREYIYKNLNSVSRKVMHLEVARVMEQDIRKNNRDVTQLIEIKNHYKLANEKMKVVKYEIEILNYYLNFNHELFPNVDDFILEKQIKVYIKNSIVLEKLKNIEYEILNLKNYEITDKNMNEIKDIELMFLYCKGRYLIREGNYSEGTSIMDRVIKLAQELNNNKVLLLGYKQMVIYGIQINEPNIMINYIIPAIKVAKLLDNISDQGVFLRLYGLYHLMKNDPKQAEKLFERSIKSFKSENRIVNNNSISIAADYNYIGEIRKANGNFEEAIELFIKAINLSGKVQISCLSTFYVNLGKTYLLINDYESMRKYFFKAKNIAEQFDSYWENVIILSYLSLAMFINEDYEETLIYLKNASSEIRTINNPRDLGSLYFIKAIISTKTSKIDNKDLDGIREYLNEPTEYYFYQAIKYLDSYRDGVEIEFLKEIIKGKELMSI